MISSFEIDKMCSKYFRYADLIQCGETIKKQKEINNLPQSEETLNAIGQLCKKILDPIQEKFGKIKLTYGFASTNLTKQINKNIYPKLDQHSGYEKNSKGNYICSRLGMACDFYIKNISMHAVAKFIIEKLPYDRLYYYGDEKPIHISYGPENNKQIIKMIVYNDRRIPKVVKAINF